MGRKAKHDNRTIRRTFLRIFVFCNDELHEALTVGIPRAMLHIPFWACVAHTFMTNDREVQEMSEAVKAR
eukprot:366115-Pleurochrysis_carterae.AAC.1